MSDLPRAKEVCVREAELKPGDWVRIKYEDSSDLLKSMGRNPVETFGRIFNINEEIQMSGWPLHSLNHERLSVDCAFIDHPTLIILIRNEGRIYGGGEYSAKVPGLPELNVEVEIVDPNEYRKEFLDERAQKVVRI